jgi:hypothetical protein
LKVWLESRGPRGKEAHPLHVATNIHTNEIEEVPHHTGETEDSTTEKTGELEALPPTPIAEDEVHLPTQIAQDLSNAIDPNSRSNESG